MKVRNVIKMLKSYLAANRLLKQTFISKIIGRVQQRTYTWKLEQCNFVNHIDTKAFLIQYYNKEEVKNVCRKYLNHQFNFLGTGWISWNKKGVSRNTIAWNRDVLTAYEFTENHLSSNLIPSLPKGVDIKRPWELGRMNHFPFMAMCAVNNDDLKESVLKEFVKQTIDLILQKPIGVGVQYYCPMDVSIRSINLLFSYDVLRQIDSQGILSTEFSDKFESYILALGKYISKNLEYDFVKQTTGNHFLCDICGLLWICAYFDNRITSNWYKECKRLFYKEIERQFLPEGSNYECSSGYHRLSCEIVAMGLVAIEWKEGKLNRNSRILERLHGMAELLELLRGRDGNIIQIGDMDSSFILKLVPHYIGDNENTLSVDYVLGLIKGIISQHDEKVRSIDYYVAQRVLKGFYIKGILTEGKGKGFFKEVCDEEQDVKYYEQFINGAKFIKQHDCSLENIGSVKKILSNIEFGIIKIIYDRADVYIRFIPDYTKMELAHAHDDVFHYEVVYSTHRWHPDCGSVNYTADIELRNYYAGSQGHNTVIHKTPIINRSGVFSASSNFQGGMLCDKESIYLYVAGPYIHVRKFIFYKSSIRIVDASDDSFEINVKDKSYSLGYGQMQNE